MAPWRATGGGRSTGQLDAKRRNTGARGANGGQNIRPHRNFGSSLATFSGGWIGGTKTLVSVVFSGGHATWSPRWSCGCEGNALPLGRKRSVVPAVSASVEDLTMIEAGGGVNSELAVNIGFEALREEDLRCFDDGVWRMGHDALARLMGVAEQRTVARLILRHLQWLNEINRVATGATRPDGGGHEWTQYWLDQEQCIYVLAKSDMPVANDITVRVVKLFRRVMRGDLSVGPRMEIRALEVAAREIVKPILEEQRRFHADVLTRMDQTESRVRGVESAVVCIQRAAARFMDKPFTVTTRALHIAVIESQYNGMCPCCRSVKIVENAEKLQTANDEHFGGRQKNAVKDTWITCAGCNQQLKDPDFHGLKYGAFLSYQDARKFYESSRKAQQTLFA